MKKKILIIVLSAVITTCSGVGIAALCGAFNGDDSSYDSIQSSTSSSSSIQQEISLPNVVERSNVESALTENFESVTLKDVYMFCDGDRYVVGDIFNGVTIGDLALYALGSTLNFNYYDDGKWYSADENGTLDDFNSVLTAIFEYQIGSNEPLALSDAQLAMAGNTTVITYFETQFGFSISSFINNPPAELGGLLPEGIKGFLSRCLELTVRDLYDLTNGDYTYVREFVENTDVDEVINLLFDVLEFDSSKSYVKLRAVLVKLLNGNLTEITIDESVKVYDIINAYFENKTSIDDYTPFESALEDVLKDIFGKFDTVGDVKEKILELDVDFAIENLSILIQALVSEEDQKLVEDVANELAKILSGTVGNIQLEFGSVEIKNIIEEILGAVEGEEANVFINELANSLADLINGSAELLEEFVTKNQNLTLDEIDEYFNGAISRIVNEAGYEWEDISTLTLADIKEVIGDIFADENGSYDEILNKIEQANGNIIEVLTIVGEALSSWLEENEEITLKDLLGDYITLEGELADLTIGKVLNKKLFSLDDIILGGEIYSLMKGTGAESLLIDLSISDLYEILTLSASEETLEVLDEVTIVEFITFLERVSDNVNAEQ